MSITPVTRLSSLTIQKNLLSRLGKPTFSAPGVAIYQGDCVELMTAIGKGNVDLTVTSPPYNIGKEYENNLLLDQYIDWSEKWINAVHRITKPHGAFWLNLGYLKIPGKAKAVPIPYLMWDKTPFFLVQEIVWNYGAGVAGRKFYSPRNEKFLWYVKDADGYTFNLDDVRDPNVKYPNQKKNGKIKVNPLGKNPTDVWEFPKVTSGRDRSSVERTPHPAQFPTALITRIVRASSNKGDLVLDPFIGSGSTAVAALRSERSVVGFELRTDYIDIAANRIENVLCELELAKAQKSLF